MATIGDALAPGAYITVKGRPMRVEGLAEWPWSCEVIRVVSVCDGVRRSVLLSETDLTVGFLHDVWAVVAYDATSREVGLPGPRGSTMWVSEDEAPLVSPGGGEVAGVR